MRNLALFLLFCVMLSIIQAVPNSPCLQRSCLSCDLLQVVLSVDDTGGLKQLALDMYAEYKSRGAKYFDFGPCQFCVIPVGLKNGESKECNLRLNILRECKPGLKCVNGFCTNSKIKVAKNIMPVKINT